MRKISDILINEKLKINNNTKIKNSLKLLKEGDPIYYINYMLTKLPKINVGKIVKPLAKANFKNSYMFQYEPPNSDDIVGVLIDGEYLDKNPDIKVCEFCSVIFSSDKYELEKKLDEHIDELIKPLQEKIDKIQNEINDLLKEKENKYNS